MNIVEENLKKGVTKGKNTFIADTAKVLGNVTLGDNVGIWYNVTIRGDINYITIGDNSNGGNIAACISGKQKTCKGFI